MKNESQEDIYDVFISCKSEDYESAKMIYNFLVDKKYSVFLADAELRKKGNAEYGKIIDAALDSAEHLILFTSKPEYVVSSYVESEWRIFIEEKRAGRKHGNLISVLMGMDVSLLPISLRHYQSFNYNQYPDVVDYLPRKKIFNNRNDIRTDIRNLFSIDKFTEEIYLDFKESYSKSLANEIVASIKERILEVINQYKKNECQLKRSQFAKIIHDSINDKVLEYQKIANILVYDIAKKHLSKISEKLGDTIFSLNIQQHILDSISTTTHNLIYNKIEISDDIIKSLGNNITLLEIDNLFVRSIAMAGLIIFPVAAILIFAIKKLLQIINSSDNIITLSEIKNVYNKYDNDKSITDAMETKLSEYIGENDTIKEKIHSVVTIYYDDCKRNLDKMGIHI